jgi:hypothetical protein
VPAIDLRCLSVESLLSKDLSKRRTPGRCRKRHLVRHFASGPRCVRGTALLALLFRPSAFAWLKVFADTLRLALGSLVDPVNDHLTQVRLVPASGRT